MHPLHIVLTALAVLAAGSFNVPELTGTYLTTQLGVLSFTTNGLVVRRTIPGLSSSEHAFVLLALSNETHRIYRSTEASVFQLPNFNDTKKRHMYLCLNAVTGSSFSYIVYLQSRKISFLDNLRLVVRHETENVSITDVCSEVPLTGDFEVMLRLGYEKLASYQVRTPASLQGVFQSSCRHEVLNTCGDQNRRQLKIIMLESELCAIDSLFDTFHTDRGELLPVATVSTTDYTYTIFFNEDDRLSTTSHSRFVCVVVREYSSHVIVTTRKDNCDNTEVTSDSHKVILEPLDRCIACGAVPVISGGRIQVDISVDDHAIGSTDSVVCDDGVTTTIVCQSNGTWNVTETMCTSVNVTTPANLALSTTEGSYGSSLVYSPLAIAFSFLYISFPCE